jgi:membrane-associated phospholipid phosphatase
VNTSPPRTTDRARPGLAEEIHALDQAIYDAVATTPTPILDAPVTWISNAANFARLWLVLAAVLGALGGSRGRRAAARGLTALGITSMTSNLAVKQLFRRHRPERFIAMATREARMPTSSSFPSGHTASAFAFATAVTAEFPLLSVPLFVLATVVGYSRVHTGVHYPTDVVAGGILGAGIGAGTRSATLRFGPLADRRSSTSGVSASREPSGQSLLLKSSRRRGAS